MIRIEIETENAAFEAPRKQVEVARILLALGGALHDSRVVIPIGKRQAATLLDVNGKRVGLIWESR